LSNYGKVACRNHYNIYWHLYSFRSWTQYLVELYVHLDKTQYVGNKTVCTTLIGIIIILNELI